MPIICDRSFQSLKSGPHLPVMIPRRLDWSSRDLILKKLEKLLAEPNSTRVCIVKPR